MRKHALFWKRTLSFALAFVMLCNFLLFMAVPLAAQTDVSSTNGNSYDEKLYNFISGIVASGSGIAGDLNYNNDGGFTQSTSYGGGIPQTRYISAITGLFQTQQSTSTSWSTLTTRTAACRLPYPNNSNTSVETIWGGTSSGGSSSATGNGAQVYRLDYAATPTSATIESIIKNKCSGPGMMLVMRRSATTGSYWSSTYLNIAVVEKVLENGIIASLQTTAIGATTTAQATANTTAYAHHYLTWADIQTLAANYFAVYKWLNGSGVEGVTWNTTGYNVSGTYVTNTSAVNCNVGTSAETTFTIGPRYAINENNGNSLNDTVTSSNTALMTIASKAGGTLGSQNSTGKVTVNGVKCGTAYIYIDALHGGYTYYTGTINTSTHSITSLANTGTATTAPTRLSSIQVNIKPVITSGTTCAGGGTLALTANTGGEAVTWTSSNTSVATISGSTLTGVATGTTTVTATSGGQTASCTVTVGSVPSPYGNGKNFKYLCGVDMFGRTFQPVTGFDTGKDVGIFYFLWLGQHTTSNTTKIYDIGDILTNYPNDLFNTSGTVNSPLGEYHYWGKPLYGYYNMYEEFVIRKHIEMLTSAGVDFMLFDVSNGSSYTYDAIWPRVLDFLLEYQNQGWNVPKIAFYTNTESTATMDHMYSVLYSQAPPYNYSSLWYKPNGTDPLIIGNNPSTTVANFFDVRASYWPQEGTDGLSTAEAAAFPWMEWVFLPYSHNGIVSVSVAQHRNGRFCDAPLNSYTNGVGDNWGRGTDSSGNRNSTTFRQGQNFERQWDNAISKNATTVFVTGWNEWVALKHRLGGTGRVVFVDCFNEEFSRDIEPMTGGYQDSFYLQLISNIRRYKGQTGTRAAPVSKTINVNSGLTQWDEVTNLYVDVAGHTNYRRNSGPHSGTTPAADTDLYVTTLPNNGIQSVKITHDGTNIYFLITCNTTAITSRPSGTDGNNWMNVFIGTGSLHSGGWNGYDYVINRSATGNINVLNSDGSAGALAGTATVVVSGNTMQIAIPRSAIGTQGSTTGFYFKVADSVKYYTDINNYYIWGKSMPMGRLSYYYYFN